MTVLLDSHVHLGATSDGRPVKIGAGRTLTLSGVLRALGEYGADLAAVVDLGTRRGLRDLEEALASARLREAEDGVFRADGGPALIGGLEVEIRLPPAGPFHVLAYAPGLDGLRALARIYREAVKNPDLSTQRLQVSPDGFRRAVERDAGGVLVVAHAFTPHRGLFGIGLELGDVFSDPDGLGLELGLSADCEIARTVGAIRDCGLLGGSDAHGTQSVGRELNAVSGVVPGFSVLRRLAERGADTIYGMNPAFGKYHRTFCPVCGTVATAPAPQLACARDAHHRVVVGVLDRCRAMAPPREPRGYPEYRYQLPLALLRGFGPAARRDLLAGFGTVHRALHEASAEELRRALGPQRAQAIMDMRRGAAPIRPGGGGLWGASGGGADPSRPSSRASSGTPSGIPASPCCHG